MLREHITTAITMRTCDNESIFRFAKNAFVAPVNCQLLNVKCPRASRGRGFGLVEILVAASILSMSMLAVSTFFQSTLKMSRATGDGNQASYLLEEGVEALKIMRDTSYASNLLNASTSTPRYFEWSHATSTWAATTTDILIDNKFERKFTIGDVYRDNTTFDISTSTSGVTFDPNVKLATVKVTWLSGSAGAGKLTPLSPTYVSNEQSSGANNIEISPDSRFAYIVARSALAPINDHVIIFSRATTGHLTKIFDIDTGVPYWSGGARLALSPDGASLYATGASSSVIMMYSRNATTGNISAIGSGSIASCTQPQQISVSPDGKSVYAMCYTSSNIMQYSRNTTTGALTSLGTIAASTCGEGTVVSSDGRHVYATTGCSGAGTVRVYNRNVTTGVLTFLSTATYDGFRTMQLAISPDGNFVYVASGGPDLVYMYRRNISTGLLTQLTPPTIYAGLTPNSIAISPDGFFAYVSNYDERNVQQYRRDVTTGLLIPLSPPSAPTRPGGQRSAGVTVSPDGNSVYNTPYFGNTIDQFSRDPGITVRTIQTYITNLFNN